MAWEDTGEELSPEEERLLRFQQENHLQLRAANLGFDMDALVHVDGAGKHLIQTAIDRIHVSMMMLLDADLSSAEARQLQIEGKAAKLMVDIVIETLENGRTAALAIADATETEED